MFNPKPKFEFFSFELSSIVYKFFLNSNSAPIPVALSPEFTQEMSFVAEATVTSLIGF